MTTTNNNTGNVTPITKKLTMAKLLSDPLLYVQHYVETSQDVYIDANGFICMDGMPYEKKLILDYKQDYNSFMAGERQKPAAKRTRVSKALAGELQMAIDIYTEQVVRNRPKVLAASIPCDQEDLGLLRTWVKAVSGNVDSIDVAVMAHFIWQVKRKLNGKDVKNHIMPIVFGKQGGGKTQAILQLLAPLTEYIYNIDLKNISDNRFTEAMSKKYVAFADELAGNERAVIDSLKHIITAKTVDARTMYTTKVMQYSQNCTFIGATNKAINEQIIDNTGMRRFYQLNAMKVLDWNTINSLDYYALWCGIDENNDEGYLTEAIKKPLSEIQVEYTSDDPFECFIEECGMEVSENSYASTEVPLNDIYDHYKDYCTSANIKIINRLTFSKKISNAGFVKTRKRLPKGGNPVAHYEMKDTPECVFTDTQSVKPSKLQVMRTLTVEQEDE